jgi:dTMP kinase
VQAGTQATALARGRGFVLALEGIDGSGKSTLATRLHQRLEQHGIPAWLTREPTGTWQGEAVRRAIRERGDPFVDAFLFLADHAAHAAEARQRVARGEVVVSDRWGDSCLAYQAASLEQRLAPRSALEWLLAAQGPVTLRPEVVLLLDIPPEQAMARIRGRAELVKYEEAAFLAKVRRNYLDLAKRFPGYVVLDATQPGEALLGQAWAALQQRGLVPP